MAVVKRVYVSGAMSGLPNFNYPAFAAAAKHLRSQGALVISPHEIAAPGCSGCLEHEHHDIHDWPSHMRADLAALLTCEGIVLLPGWSASRGAKLELATALALEMHVYYLEDDGLHDIT